MTLAVTKCSLRRQIAARLRLSTCNTVTLTVLHLSLGYATPLRTSLLKLNDWLYRIVNSNISSTRWTHWSSILLKVPKWWFITLISNTSQHVEVLSKTDTTLPTILEIGSLMGSTKPSIHTWPRSKHLKNTLLLRSQLELIQRALFSTLSLVSALTRPLIKIVRVSPSLILVSNTLISYSPTQMTKTSPLLANKDTLILSSTILLQT